MTRRSRQEKDFYEGQEFLAEEYQEAYLPVFGEEYWQETTDHQVSSIKAWNNRASEVGKKLLSALTKANDGVLSLGDPLRKDDEVVIATAFDGLRIVKAVEEMRVSFGSGRKKSAPKGAWTSKHIDGGFIVTRYSADGVTFYRRYTNWHASAETIDGSAAFFPLEVDHSKSFSSGEEGDAMATIKVTGTNPNAGVKEITAGKTTVLKDPTSQTYMRTIRSAVYQPIITRNGLHLNIPSAFRT